VHRFMFRRFFDEQGAASVIAIALLAIGAMLMSTLGLMLALQQARVNLQELVDTTARTTADMQRGAMPGYPCEFASQYLSESGINLTYCRIVENDVAIEANVNFSIWTLSARALAGPIE